MNIEAVLKRANKLIKKFEDKEKAAWVFESEDGIYPPEHSGIIIIYDNSPTDTKTIT